MDEHLILFVRTVVAPQYWEASNGRGVRHLDDAAKALAVFHGDLAKHLRPLGGWPCHYRRIPAAWHNAYGWGREASLDALLSVCSKVSQPRLDAAWQVAKILAS